MDGQTRTAEVHPEFKVETVKLVYEGSELERMPVGPRESPHDPALAEALSVARAAGRAPRESSLVGAVARSR